MKPPWLALLAWFALACTEDAYVVGAVCGERRACVGGGSGGETSNGGSSGSGQAGAPPGEGLSLDLTGSGVERLPTQLFELPPTHFLIADDATAESWPARVGADFTVQEPTALTLREPSPFADPGRVLSHVGLAFTSKGSWAEADGALALELVARAEPGATLLAQTDGSSGLVLSVTNDGQLQLQLQNEASQLVVTSPELVSDAWHHCLAIVDASQNAAQLFCNGQAGTAVAPEDGLRVPTIQTRAVLGSATTARVHWAQLALWRAAAFEPRGAWTDVARERFARLVGTYASGAREPLPLPELRASGAYIDMSPTDAPELRRLHPVGQHWPRIVCRPIGVSPRFCGLLVETASSRPLATPAFGLEQWQTSALSLQAAAAVGGKGQRSLFGLVPSTQTVEHLVERAVPLADGPGVLSLFARPGEGRRLRVEVVDVASVVFDVGASSVVSAQGALVARAEPWGEGLVRLSVSFEVDAGPGMLRLQPLDDDSSAVFAGSGEPSVFAGEVDLRFRSASVLLPTLGDIQQADRLAYPAGNGNLPKAESFAFSAEVWLPDAPLLADAAILNANFAGRFDPQVNLFVSPLDGAVHFWGRLDDEALWQFASSSPVNDGEPHRLVASVGAEGASVDVDGQRTSAPGRPFDLSRLDRVEIGTSTSSSGPLTGLVRHIVLAPAR